MRYFQVSIIRTQGNGDAKDIMELLEDSNAVLVAGGDGTLMVCLQLLLN